MRNEDLKDYEIRSQVYGNTGGGCMVATLEVYLPAKNQTVWANCDGESMLITTADFHWNRDNKNGWERPRSIEIFSMTLADGLTMRAVPWVPIMRDTLKYTLEQEVGRIRTLTISVTLLPESLLQDFAPDDIRFLKEQGQNIFVTSGKELSVDDPTQATTMELQL